MQQEIGLDSRSAGRPIAIADGALAAQRNAAAQRDHLDVVHGACQPADFNRHLVGQFARRA